MKYSKTILGLAAASLLTAALQAQVEVTITGSTAFRSIIYDRVPTLFDAGYVSVSSDANKTTINGTMSSVFTAAPTTPVTVYMSFSGSATGMLAVKNGTPQTVVVAGNASQTTTKVPDFALSDVFPGAANPPIAASAFANDDLLGVVPFVFVKNNALAGVANITRDQALLLMTAGGIMPASFLGGDSTILYLIGRDSGSGTRISVEKDIGFKGSPVLWQNNGGVWSTTPGFASGSSVATTVSGNTPGIGYLGLGDFATISTTCSALTYNGVAYSTANVVSGKYGLWGYEHMVSRVGISANQNAVRSALKAAVTSQAYQTSNANYVGKFEAIADMHVERGADGGTITSLDF